MKFTRAKFTPIQSNRCGLHYEDATVGHLRYRQFFAPVEGGYVREVGLHNDFPQVCDRLASTGDTLMWYPGGITFVDFIRREYRRMRGAERRIANKL